LYLGAEAQLSLQKAIKSNIRAPITTPAAKPARAIGSVFSVVAEWFVAFASTAVAAAPFTKIVAFAAAFAKSFEALPKSVMTMILLAQPPYKHFLQS
jgi:hypothetical protein